MVNKLYTHPNLQYILSVQTKLGVQRSSWLISHYNNVSLWLSSTPHLSAVCLTQTGLSCTLQAVLQNYRISPKISPVNKLHVLPYFESPINLRKEFRDLMEGRRITCMKM